MSVTSLHLLYKEVFEPIVRPLDNVAITYSTDKSTWTYSKVVYVEPLQPQVIDLGSLDASTTTNYPAVGSSKDLNELKLGENELGQYRIYPLDDIILEVRQPAAMSRFVNRTSKTYITKVSPPNFVEIFVYEDNYVPQVVPYNPLFSAQDTSRIMIPGFRYIMEPLSSAPESYTVIPVSGVAPTMRAPRG